MKSRPGRGAGGAALRVLIADGLNGRRDAVTAVVASLGNEVVGRTTTLAAVGSVTASEWPDVALVILEESSAQALGKLKRITPRPRVL